jgi:hypothetical protein
MKVSSITSSSLENSFSPEQQGKSFLAAAQEHVASLLKIAGQIGTSIALGEKGDLEAAHEFRNQNYGK